MNMPSELPVIAIVGRPNVGKSTLFNRIIGRRMSIVDDRPGVTRDSIVAETRVEGKPFYLVDTGGLTSYANKSVIEEEVEKQIHRSIAGAKAVVFVVDCSAGPVPEDKFVAEVLRKTGIEIIFAANKADSPSHDVKAENDFFELGIGEALAVSALHSRGMDELFDRISEFVPAGVASVKDSRINFCVVGRPNVGKSSIVNAILGWDRCVVSGEPGTTRDSVEVEFVWEETPFTIVDTAGQRRKKKHIDDVEFYSIARAKESVRRSDVGVLVLSAVDGLLEGDKRIAAAIIENQKGFLLAVNKMDLVDEDATDDFIKYLVKEAPFLRNMPIVFVSALHKEGMDSIIGNIQEIHERMNTPLPLALLENVIYDVRTLFSPRTKGRSPAAIKSVIHDRVNPPRIVLTVDDKDSFTPDYMKMMENRIREVFNLAGVPLELAVYGATKKKT